MSRPNGQRPFSGQPRLTYSFAELAPRRAIRIHIYCCVIYLDVGFFLLFSVCAIRWPPEIKRISFVESDIDLFAVDPHASGGRVQARGGPAGRPMIWLFAGELFALCY